MNQRPFVHFNVFAHERRRTTAAKIESLGGFDCPIGEGLPPRKFARGPAVRPEAADEPRPEPRYQRPPLTRPGRPGGLPAEPVAMG